MRCCESFYRGYFYWGSKQLVLAKYTTCRIVDCIVARIIDCIGVRIAVGVVVRIVDCIDDCIGAGIVD